MRDRQPLYNVGSNCNEYFKRGEGACYRTQFGDWRCYLNGSDARSPAMRIAPLGGVRPVAGGDAAPPPDAGPPQRTPPPARDPGAAPPAGGGAGAATGGRRVARDPNRPIGVNDTVAFSDPENPGRPANCTVLAVHVGAYRVQCMALNPMQRIVRDIDVARPGAQPPETSAAVPPSGPPFKAGDLVLVTPMGLQAEDNWQLCVVISNQVRSSNSYTVDCGYRPQNVLPEWVRADPTFQ